MSPSRVSGGGARADDEKRRRERPGEEGSQRLELSTGSCLEVPICSPSPFDWRDSRFARLKSDLLLAVFQFKDAHRRGVFAVPDQLREERKIPPTIALEPARVLRLALQRSTCSASAASSPRRALASTVSVCNSLALFRSSTRFFFGGGKLAGSARSSAEFFVLRGVDPELRKLPVGVRL